MFCLRRYSDWTLGSMFHQDSKPRELSFRWEDSLFSQVIKMFWTGQPWLKKSFIWMVKPGRWNCPHSCQFAQWNPWIPWNSSIEKDSNAHHVLNSPWLSCELWWTWSLVFNWYIAWNIVHNYCSKLRGEKGQILARYKQHLTSVCIICHTMQYKLC